LFVRHFFRIFVLSFPILGWGQAVALPPQPLDRAWEFIGDEKHGYLQSIICPANFPGVCVAEDFSNSSPRTGIFCLDASGGVVWEKSFPEIFREFAFHDDSSVVVAFRFFSADITTGLFRRLDMRGNVLWEKTVDLTTNPWFSADSFLTITGPADGRLELTKYELDSNRLWTAQVPAGNGNQNRFVSVVPLPDGGYFLSGLKGSVTTNMPLITTSDFWMVRLDGKGSVLWDKTLTLGTGSSQGGSAVRLPGGDVAVAADIGGYAPAHGYVSEALLLRVNPAGEIVWRIPFTATEAEGIYQLNAMPDGGVIGSGEVTDFRTSWYWMFRVGENGEFRWDTRWLVAGFFDSAISSNGDIYAFTRSAFTDHSVSKFNSENASFAAEKPTLRAPPRYVRYFPLNNYQLELLGEPGKIYDLEVTRDLKNWELVGKRAPGVIQLTPRDNGGPVFFRAVDASGGSM